MTEDELTTLWLGAFRYYLYRQTYNVHGFCNLLTCHWEALPDELKEFVEHELGDAFTRDDLVRHEEGDHFLPLGTDDDRHEWEQVMHLCSTP